MKPTEFKGYYAPQFVQSTPFPQDPSRSQFCAPEFIPQMAMPPPQVQSPVAEQSPQMAPAQPSTPSQGSHHRGKRRSKNDNIGRIYKCTHCDRTYLSYPALYTHNKTKHAALHQPVFPTRGRGRPRKNVTHESKPDPTSTLYFRTEEKQGGPTAIVYGFEAVFAEMSSKCTKKYNKYEEHPLYVELYKLHQENTKTLTYDEEHPGVTGIGNPPQNFQPAVLQHSTTTSAVNVIPEKADAAAIVGENAPAVLQPVAPPVVPAITTSPIQSVTVGEEDKSAAKNVAGIVSGPAVLQSLPPLKPFEEAKTTEIKLKAIEETQKKMSDDTQKKEVQIKATEESPAVNEQAERERMEAKSKKKCDEIFAEYLNYVARNVSKECYKQVLKFLFLFRECLNSRGTQLQRAKQLQTDVMTEDKPEETDFCLKNNAELAPEISNEFVTVYLDEVKPDLGQFDPIELTQNLCHWLFMNEYTCSRLNLIR